jgi:hypothetical protein
MTPGGFSRLVRSSVIRVLCAFVLGFLFAVSIRSAPVFAADAQCPFVSAYPNILPANNTTTLVLLCNASGSLDVNDTNTYNAAFGQTAISNSFKGVAGWNYTNQSVDALLTAPFGGNNAGTGYPAAYGQPGVLVVQCGGVGGSCPISGNLGGPYSSATNQTPTSASFMGTGGIDSAAGSFYPFSTGIAGTTITAGKPAQYVMGVGTNGAVPVSGTITISSPAPYSAATSQPTTPASFYGEGGTDGTNFQPDKTDVNGNRYVTTGGQGSGTFTSTASTLVISLAGGANAVSFSVLNPGSTVTGNLTVSADDGAGTGAASYLWTPVCFTSTGSAITSGAIPPTTGVAYKCYLGPHTSFRIASAAYGGSGTLTAYWSTGVNVVGTASPEAAYTIGQIINGQSSGNEKLKDSIPGTYSAVTSASDSLNHSVGIASNTQTQYGPGAPFMCEKTASINYTASTQVVALAASQNIYVCGYSLSVAGATTPTAGFEYGTGTTCATGATALSGLFPAGVYNMPSGISPAFIVPQGDALCLVLAGTSPSVQGWISYGQW